MFFIRILYLITFPGHPIVKNMDDMPEIGLFLNDLNNFDSSAEILVNEMQGTVELSNAFNNQQAWTMQLGI